MEYNLPSSAALELTDNCNLACGHCFQRERRSRAFMAPETAFKALQYADAAGALEVTLTGGEPTLSPDFTLIYERCRAMGFITSVFSNGVRFEAEHWKSFGRLSPHNLEITLYGATDSAYFAFTRRSAWQSVKHNVDRACALGIPVSLKFPLLRSTVGSLPAVVEFARSRDLPLLPNVQITGSGDYIARETLTPDEVVTLNAQYGLGLESREGVGGCDLGRTVYIKPDGLIQGCAAFRLGARQHVQDVDAFSGTDLAEFAEYANSFDGICPAWMMRSNQTNNLRLMSYLSESTNVN